MTYSTPSLADRRRANMVDDIHDVVCEIEMIRRQLIDHGFDQAAASLGTTIADLRWQVEELMVDSS